MPAYDSWDVVSGAESGQLILCVNFPAAGRREAGFAELAAKINLGYRFLQPKRPSPPQGPRMLGIAHVHRWIDEIRDQPVTAVLGHRVGGVFATALAEGISQWQRAPRLILFNPQPASVRLLGQELLKEIKSISSLLSDDEIEHAGRQAAAIADSESFDIENAAAAALAAYWEVSSVAYDRVGIGGDCFQRSFDLFRSYISLVTAAGEIDPSEIWKHSTAIVSMPLDDTCGSVGRRISFDVRQVDLLRSDSVAKKVLELLDF